MLALIADALDELKDAFVPTLAKAENDVCTGGFGERSSDCINIGLLVHLETANLKTMLYCLCFY